MASVNKVILIGNAGADTELRHTKTGRPVAGVRIATNERWTDKEGKKQERTEWHSIVVWDKMAEVCAQYVKKGKQVYVEGRLQTRSWEDDEGIKRYATEIVALSVQFLGSANGTERPDKQAGYVPGGDDDVPGDMPEQDIPF